MIVRFASNEGQLINLRVDEKLCIQIFRATADIMYELEKDNQIREVMKIIVNFDRILNKDLRVQIVGALHPDNFANYTLRYVEVLPMGP